MVDFKYPEKTRTTINNGWENVTKDNEDNKNIFMLLTLSYYN